MATRDTTDSEIREAAAVYDPDFRAPAAGAPAIGLPEEAIRWGSRWIEERSADGGVCWREVPLTWEDLLDPQEGDVMVHSTLHSRIIRELAQSLHHWFRGQGRDDVLVTDDVKMLWGLPGVSNVAPDVAVIPNVRAPLRPRDSFRVAEEGTRPILAIEVISKSSKEYDQKTKPEIYQQAEVPECILIDPLEEPWKLFGQRLSVAGGEYRPIEPMGGALVSEAAGLRFRIGEDGASLVVEDLASGERLPNLDTAAAAREDAERRAAEAKAAREDAERRAVREAAARVQEAAAREQAERHAARVEAEKQALEERLAELEKKLEAFNEPRTSDRP